MKLLDLKGGSGAADAEEGAGGGFGGVARAGRLDQVSGSSPRERSGAGWGIVSTPLPARLGPAGS